ncbi:helix-turn-helix domain-containing protein [Ekhidna sp.]|uniref:helix-turn-helix domain-containing protein n=1 Tax=Ekhidna sp. TaxID=2608089 RepID=UPI003BAA8597
MSVSFSTIASLFAGLLGFIVLLFFLGSQRRSQHRFLIYFLLILIYLQVYSFTFHSGLMLKFPAILNTNIPLVFLLGPFLYTYICHLQQKALSKISLAFHLMPFIFVALYFFNFYLQEEGYKFNILANEIGAELVTKPYNKSFQSDPWNLNGWIVVEIQCLHLFVYGILSYLSLRKSEIRSKWLLLLTFGLILAAMILFFTQGGVINGVRFLGTFLPKPSNDLFAAILLYVAAIYLIINPKAFIKYIPKYRKSSLDEDWRKRKAEALLTTLEKNKLYLNTNLSLQLVADVMGIKKHHLSQVINQELGCTFFELINRYRIKEARHVLSQEEDCKMEALAYQLGYRSKSAFFNAFKKETSQTPGQFARGI